VGSDSRGGASRTRARAVRRDRERGRAGHIAERVPGRVEARGCIRLRAARADRRARRTDRDVVETARADVQRSRTGLPGGRARHGVRPRGRSRATRTEAGSVRPDREGGARGNVAERVVELIAAVSAEGLRAARRDRRRGR